jgi:hypothetical protein
MVRQTSPKKNQEKESEKKSLKTRKKKIKEKYRHQKHWLEEDDYFESDLKFDSSENYSQRDF